MRELIWAPGSAAVLDYMTRPGGPAISPEAKLVYLALFSRCNDAFECWPSSQTLADGLGYSNRLVRYRLDELDTAGLIDRSYPPGKPVTFRLHPPWAPCKRDARAACGATLAQAATLAQDAGEGLHVVPPTLARGATEVTHISNPYKKPNEEDDAAGPQLTAGSRAPDTWVSFYERKFGRPLSPVDFQKVAELQQRGVTDELIIAVLEEAITQKKRDKLGWAVSVIGDMVPNGVMTVAAWRSLEAERESQAAERAAKRKDGADRGKPGWRDPVVNSDAPVSRWEST